MPTKASANAYITNNTGGNAAIQMTHRYANSSPDTLSCQLAPGETSKAPLTVNFETGFTSQLADWWWINIQVKDGPNAGNYSSAGTFGSPLKQCLLKASDSGKDFTNTVDTKTFAINMPSGGCTASMVKTGKYSPITNVFVLMLENRSFDHMLGFSGITGTAFDQKNPGRNGKPTSINGLTGSETNTFIDSNGTSHTCTAASPARDPMTEDPGHEFPDTLEQLCGKGTANPFPAGPYPAIYNSGFASNYSTPKVDGGIHFPAPDTGDVKDIMSGCTPDQIPILFNLAKNYVVCDSWHSSMPGPTWPNRFFAMCGTAGGLDASPTQGMTIDFETEFGFNPKAGNIFTLVGKDKWKIYSDYDDQFNTDPNNKGTLTNGGSWAIVAGLNGIFEWSSSITKYRNFKNDLAAPYQAQFTWIEPNYGNASASTYKGGSSQHPTDSLGAGERLISDVFNTIRYSPVWPTSLLIITYDEHGGYYDHVAPPPAVAPGDGNMVMVFQPPPHSLDPGAPLPPPIEVPLNRYGFDFKRLGVRVPAVVVSPRIQPNIVDHTLYDHTTILKTVEDLFGLSPLTARDAAASSLAPLLSADPPHADEAFELTGISAPEPRAAAPPTPITEEELAALHAKPLPGSGNVHGFLSLALKAELGLSDGSAEAKKTILDKFQTIKTHGDAKFYIGSVAQKIEAARARQEAEESAAKSN